MVFKDSLVLGKIGTSPALVVHKDSIKVKPPRNYPGSNWDWYRQKAIYSELESNQRLIAFHGGEIWEIRYAELLLGKGSFGKTLQFITN